MKLKLPITEEFLWDLYTIVEGLDEIYSTLFPQPLTMKRAVYPEFYEIKRIFEKKRRRKDFSKLISYLKRKGWIKVKEIKERKVLLLMPLGREKVLKIRKRFSIHLSKKKRKDGKLLMAAFDIPEKKKGIRNYFRGKLIELGFQQFQKSIWISPYDTLKELKEIIENLQIDEFVKIFLIEEKEF